MRDSGKLYTAIRYLNDGKLHLEKELAYLEKTYPALKNDEVKGEIEAYEFAIKVMQELSQKLAVEYDAEFWKNRKEEFLSTQQKNSPI